MLFLRTDLEVLIKTTRSVEAFDCLRLCPLSFVVDTTVRAALRGLGYQLMLGVRMLIQRLY